MSLALQNSVDLELLIEESRDELFERITFQDTYVAPSHVPNELPHNLRASSVRRTPAAVDETLTFCVLDSFLSDDGSERIFEVQCGNFKCYYYAFEFIDYIACPAFLVSRFNLIDYACLDVSNGSHYYYIFLSRKDALPNILGKRSDFRGEFELEIPSEAHRLLTLNPRNKDSNSFILLDWKNKNLCDECERFCSNPSDILMKSKVASDYWFVPPKLKISFEDKHSLFNSEYLSSTILVHGDSKSFAEFQKFTKPITESLEDDNPFIGVPLASIFTKPQFS